MLLADAEREFAALYAWSQPIERIWLTIKARWFTKHLWKNEKELLERLDQAILDIIDNPNKTQQTTAIGALFWQTL